MDRADVVHQNFMDRLIRGELPAATTDCSLNDCDLSAEHMLQLFKSQIMSRHLDRHSRKMQADGYGYYTIGSSGHEATAAVAAATRVSDPAFLHYRDAAFQIERASQIPDQTPIRDMALSFTTSTEDPISGGRHKVLGSKALNIWPQTSTIASHLPKAVGAAFSIAIARTLKPEHQSFNPNAIILCSFGDASLNHSTAQGALNTAGWASYQNTPMPLLFICEDNGIGISTKSPQGWVAASTRQRPGIKYFHCNGLSLLDTYRTAHTAAQWVRQTRKPAFLQMETVRLYGHAGADAQLAYLTQAEIDLSEANDPLLHTARDLLQFTDTSPEKLLEIYQAIDQEVAEVVRDVKQAPRLQSAKQVMASILPPFRSNRLPNSPSKQERADCFGASDGRALGTPQHMAKLINFTLTDLMLEHKEIVLAGQDIGPKGGVYGVTQRLHERFGRSRVINTLLDEQSILGLSIGMAHNGLIPVPEIQFLAYLHNAEDQIRGEAATLSFFSNGQFTNPMVIRIAGLGYQRGFGGHFHNDNSVAVLRDIPGVVVACPSNGLDAVWMLRECIRLAREEQRVVVFLEPIARYMTRDLHTDGDGLWTFDYPTADKANPARLGSISKFGDGRDVAIVSYANGYFLARKAEQTLREKHSIHASVFDLRWISPLPLAALAKALQGYSNILIVDECRSSGSLSEGLLANLLDHLKPGTAIARETAKDSFIATGPAYGATLPSEQSIVDAVLQLIGGKA